jgi:hypothetical protein
MGSAGKKFNSWTNKTFGQGTVQRFNTITDPLGIGHSRLNQDGLNDTPTITSPGGLNESDAAALHERYMGANAINSYKQSRSAEVNKLLGSAMEQAKGLSGVENAAIRSNALSSINAQNQGALKALRASQAASGVRGGLAASQFAQQQGEATKALSTFERDLVADNINYKREGTKTALEAVTNQENIERDLAAQKLNTILAIRSENASLEAARMQAEAAANAGRRGGGKGGGK